jgi:cell division protein FtsB
MKAAVQEFKTKHPKRTKILLTLFVLSTVGALSLTILVLGYLYYKKSSEVRDLKADNSQLADKAKDTEEYQAELEDLEEDYDLATDEIETLEASVTEKDATIERITVDNTAYATKIANIKKYNDVYDFLADLIIAHGGATGWTQADYQAGRNLAQATGDQGLLDAIDAAWYNTGVDPVLRVGNVIKELVEGITANL